MSGQRVIDEAPGVVARPAALEAWARTARAGDRFVYATRCSLPPGSAGAACARLLAARELVYLARFRVQDGSGEFSYFAERSSKVWSEGAPAATRVVLTAGEVEIDGALEVLACDTVLPVLTRSAQFRRPCPTDVALVERTGLSIETVKACVAALRGLKLIHVTAAPPPTNRRVTVLATGFQTGLAA